MNLFVTGGTGFFGKALLRHWKSTGSPFKKIFILSRKPKIFQEKYSYLIEGLPIEFVKGDILNLSEVKIDQDLDVVLHAATDSTIGPSLSRLDVYTQITKGTEEVLQFSANNSCKKFVLASSGGVYGAQPSNMEKIPEEYLGMPDPLDPNSAYGIGKRAAEHLVALYADKYRFDYVIARCFAFVGQDLPLDKHFAIGNFIKDGFEGNNIEIYGDGTTIRSYMYQEDLAQILDHMTIKKIPNGAYNVGSEEAVSLNELANKIKNVINNEIKIKILGREDGNIKNKYVPDISKLKSEIDQIKFRSLDLAIKLTAEKIKLKK